MENPFLQAKFLNFAFARRDYGYYIPTKKIPYMDLTFCLEGSMEYIFENELVVLQKGDAILYPPGSVRMRRESAKACTYASFNLLLHENFTPQMKGHLKNCVQDDTVSMLEAFKKTYEAFSPYKQEKCASLFSYLYYRLAETVIYTEHPGIKSAKQYITAHLAEPMTLTEIAKNAHLAPNYLCALFKKEAGVTVTEYIKGQRIDLAKRLMVTKDDSLTKIAQQCGFGDYNYFSCTFKKITGLTPVQYRKRKST